MERFPFVGQGAENNDWKRIYVRRSRLQKGWEGGKAGDFTVTSMRGHDGYITSIDILKNQAITGGSTGQIKVWKTNNSKLSFDCAGHTQAISTVKFNDIYILSGSIDGSVKLWDTQTGVLLRSADTASRVNSLAFNANEVLACTATGLEMYDIRSYQRTAHRNLNPVTKALILENGNIATVESNGVHVLDPRRIDQSLFVLHRISQHMEYAGNDTVALASLDDVILYNYRLGTQIALRNIAGANFTLMKADSARVIVGTSTGQMHIIRHRDIAVRTINAHEGAINDLQFDSQRIVTAGADNSIKVWKLSEGRSLYTLLGGSLQLRGAAKAHPTKPGCSQLVYDENRIVGAFANVLKSFNFG